MDLLRFLKKRKKDATSELLLQMMQKPYEMQHPEACKEIWSQYVPARGQAQVLQGELLRALEKLRWEAQNNGNINWDEDFVYLCSFIRDTLCSMDLFSQDDKQKIAAIMDYFQHHAEEAYTEDNLYDVIADYIAQLYIQHPEPIRHEINTLLGI